MLTGIQAPKGPAICRDEKLKSAKVLLIEWQLNTWLSCYSKAPYGPQALLPDDVLHKITSSLHIEMIDDLKRIGWSSSCAERHGAAILQALQAHNEQFDVTQNIEKTERLEAKKQKMAERQAVQCATVKAEHECAKAIKHSQPKPPHLSHAKKPVLLESGCTPLQVPNHTPSPIMIVAPQPHPASSMPSSIYITSTGNPYPTCLCLDPCQPQSLSCLVTHTVILDSRPGKAFCKPPTKHLHHPDCPRHLLHSIMVVHTKLPHCLDHLLPPSHSVMIWDVKHSLLDRISLLKVQVIIACFSRIDNTFLLHYTSSLPNF